MPLYTAMNNLKAIIPITETEAKNFLNNLAPVVQEQIITAIYLGREHIHSETLRDDTEISRKYTDHIGQDEYARIIHEKGGNIITYLDKLEQCSKASNFDLNTL